MACYSSFGSSPEMGAPGAITGVDGGTNKMSVALNPSVSFSNLIRSATFRHISLCANVLFSSALIIIFALKSIKTFLFMLLIFDGLILYVVKIHCGGYFFGLAKVEKTCNGYFVASVCQGVTKFAVALLIIIF